MLIITRREGETVVVECEGKILQIKIAAVEGQTIKLGFEGPQSFKIYREEILKKTA